MSFSRRKFLGSIPCLALGSTTLYSSLINTRAIHSLMGSASMDAGDGYKALVCVLLNGGNDSYNMLVPRSEEAYQEYAKVRSNLALPQAQLLPIDSENSDGRTYGLHPAMVGLQDLFQRGKLAFVSNVGTLIEPVTKNGYFTNRSQIPLGLFSHIDQVMHWQTGIPQERLSKGWGGKMAELLQSLNSNQEVSMNISLSGNNIFQRGDQVEAYAINNDGAVAIRGYDSEAPLFKMIRKDIDDMINKDYQDLYQNTYRNILSRSVNSNQIFNAALEEVDLLEEDFTEDNPLSQDLRMIARSIAGRSDLGAKRQIFFVELGGFDNHDELLNNHEELMTTVDQALSEFYQATEKLGVADCVTTFTVSDFSRTLTSNGNGTDHAWGGNVMVMGGSVQGKRIYGNYPVISLDTDLELGGGVLIPTTSADEYFAEIALWFGVSPNDLNLVLPNIGNFYNTLSGTPPIGFLNHS